MLQCTNTTCVISRCGTFSKFLSLDILLSVLPNSLIASGVKSSRWYPVLILYVILFSVLFTYIFLNDILMMLL